MLWYIKCTKTALNDWNMFSLIEINCAVAVFVFLNEFLLNSLFIWDLWCTIIKEYQIIFRLNGTIFDMIVGNERLHLFVIYDLACELFFATLTELSQNWCIIVKNRKWWRFFLKLHRAKSNLVQAHNQWVMRPHR